MVSIFEGDISDTSEEEDIVPSFADKVKSNTIQREDNNADPTSQQRNLTDLEQQTLLPNNVMLDRPCTAFFKTDEFMAANDFFDVVEAEGMPATAVRCFQRSPHGHNLVAFINLLTLLTSLSKQHLYVLPAALFLLTQPVQIHRRLISHYITLRMNYQTRRLKYD